MVEHDPVYTLGKNADENHLLQSRRDDVPLFRIERGGDVTFHGPGQIVGYPILDLHNHQLSINWYMRSLEEVLIRTLAEFCIESERREGLTGVWVEDRKIASLGVRVSRWVTMHGFALNVNTDLSYFDGIIPCGIFECGVTSMERILGEELVLEVVQEKIEQMFVNVFDLKV
jgi:lipoyl(octanoyl) transferase